MVQNEKYYIRVGVIQGGILSPKLFNIFYDSLINKLDNLKYFIIAYADDITIAVIEHDHIIMLLEEVDSWADEYNMKFNKNKSVIIMHRKPNRYKDEDTIEGLKKVLNTKVLGF